MKYFRSVEKGRIVKRMILTINVMSYINKRCNIEPFLQFSNKYCLDITYYSFSLCLFYVCVGIRTELVTWCPQMSLPLPPPAALSCQKFRIILYLQHFTNPSLLSLPLPAALSCPSSTLASVPPIVLLTATVIFFFLHKMFIY